MHERIASTTLLNLARLAGFLIHVIPVMAAHSCDRFSVATIAEILNELMPSPAVDSR